MLEDPAVPQMIVSLQSSGVWGLVVIPASGLHRVYEHFEHRRRCIYATREEEAVAIAAGLAIGGRLTVVLMQQSGVGNALNATFTLADAYGIYFPILVYDRGPADDNPVQRLSSAQTGKLLAALDCVDIDFRDVRATAAFTNNVRRRHRWMRYLAASQRPQISA